jgi:hypothetical protein
MLTENSFRNVGLYANNRFLKLKEKYPDFKIYEKEILNHLLDLKRESCDLKFLETTEGGKLDSIRYNYIINDIIIGIICMGYDIPNEMSNNFYRAHNFWEWYNNYKLNKSDVDGN